MTTKKSIQNILKKAKKSKSTQKYVFRLFVAGTTPQSQLAIKNVKELCEKYLDKRYSLEIIDIYQNPVLAIGEDILAAPTLLKKLPLPLRRIIGNMSDAEKIQIVLDLTPGIKNYEKGKK